MTARGAHLLVKVWGVGEGKCENGGLLCLTVRAWDRSNGVIFSADLVYGPVDVSELIHGALPAAADLRHGGGVGHHDSFVPQQVGAVDPAVLVGPL